MSTGVRFAPSPTGTFHLGNLRTAWVSYRLSRMLNEPWIVRFEDIDQPRVVDGAQNQQLSDLKRLKMIPDQVTVQSLNRARHVELFLKAKSEQIIYPCTCSRREVQMALSQMASAPNMGSSNAPIYNGQCRNHPIDLNRLEPTTAIAWRFRMSDSSGMDDFIVGRTFAKTPVDSFEPSYHWACAIDDFDGDYRLIVRAIDLESALGPQRAIQTWLNLDEKRPVAFPAVFHTRIVTRDDGGRLEKRTQGVTLRELLERGIQPSELLQKFERSFSNLTHSFEPGSVMQESSIPLRMHELIA